MPLRGAGCKLRWVEPVEARVRASRVIVETPGFDDLARLFQAAEQVLGARSGIHREDGR